MAERIAVRTYYTEAKIGTDGLSNVIDGKGYRLTKIFMPAEWTDAVLTFQEAPSPDGPFQDLYDDVNGYFEFDANGDLMPITDAVPIEVSIPVVAGKNTVISINKDCFAGMTYFKIRSGTSDNPISQAEKRTIGLLFVGI